MRTNYIIHLRLALLLVFTSAVIIGCKKDTSLSTIKSKGKIINAGMTTYMYGTHQLQNNTNGQIFYALRSTKYNLSEYEGKTVTITGHKVKGYPKDGGPTYLDVTRIKE